MSSVAVLGAGPAGLIAALLAAEAGHEVRVFEAAGRVGGMAASFDVAGQRVDYGSHRLHPTTPPHLMARLQSLLGPDLQARERHGRIRLRDRWVGFPLRTTDMVRSLPVDFGARVALDTVTGPLRRSSDGSFAGELRRRLGPTIVDEFYGPYSHKLYGTDAALLDAEHARRRVAASSPLAILARAVRASRSEGRRFWYPRLGYGQIAEAIADAAVAAGATIELDAPVRRVRRLPERCELPELREKHGTPENGTREDGRVADAWVVATGVPGAFGEVETGAGTAGVVRQRPHHVGIASREEGAGFHADVVLSTVPMAALASAIEPSPPVEVRRGIQAVRARAMVLVYLVVPRPQYTEFDAHYFPGLDVRIARLSEPKNYRDGPDPKATTVLCAELACWPDDDLWRATDADLGELVTADLGRAGLPDPGAVHVETRRLRSVYPIYEAATATARHEIEDWHAGLDDLLVFGRQGLAVPDNLHHVLAMGDGAVGVLGANGTIDRRAWSARRTDFATHVVQD